MLGTKPSIINSYPPALGSAHLDRIIAFVNDRGGRTRRAKQHDGHATGRIGRAPSSMMRYCGEAGIAQILLISRVELEAGKASIP